MASKTGSLAVGGTDFLSLNGGLNVDNVAVATSPLQNSNQVTFLESGTFTGASISLWMKSPAGTWINIGAVDQQGLSLTPSGAIALVNSSAKSWVFQFPVGTWIDARVVLAAISTGSVAVEINSGLAPAGGVQIAVAVPVVTSLGLAGGVTTLAGLLAESSATGITAFAGGGQGSAVALAAELNRVATVTTAGDSVRLPASTPGVTILVVNTGGNSVAVFPATGDAVNGQAANASVTQMPNSVVFYACTGAGNWYAEGIGGGYAGSLPTVSYTNAIAAFAGGGQASATQLTSAINRVTAVATAADSVKLPASTPGVQLTVANSHASNSLNAFPATGDAINALAANAAFAVAAGKAANFYCANAGQWHAILTA